MKLITTTLFAFILFPLICFSQSNTFNWNDSVFHIGSKRIVHTIYFGLDYSGIDTTGPSGQTLDTLVQFLQKNPCLKVEISYHTDQRGTYNHNMILSRAIAQSLVYLLTRKGIDSARLIPKGYGATRPIITMAETNKLKTKQEKEAAWQINRRFEITILATDYGHETFNWNDTRFYIGSKRIIHTIKIDWDHGGIAMKDSTTILTIDSIYNFLKSNPSLKIELASHTSQLGSYRHNLIASQMRAEQLAIYLIDKGIDSLRLIPKGYGFTKPIIPLQQIKQLKTWEEQSKLYDVNLRFEITILSTDYKKP